jgi:D-glycero-D-manno-heptose 1,7-bisphosphate phosphatase
VNLKTKAVFLDRDGVINIDKNYVHKIEDFEFVEEVFEVLKELLKRGYKLFVVTNQSGIGRGYYSEDDFFKLTKYMLETFESKDIEITKVYHCPHSPESNCECRKPKPAMLLRAKDEFNIDMANSIMIGDKKSDIEAGKNAKVGKTIFIGDKKEPKADYCVTDILDILDIIN